MANIEGNLAALRESLAQIFPMLEKGRVQTPAGDGAQPVQTVRYSSGSAPTSWTQIDVEGYEINFVAPALFAGKRSSRSVGYVRLGQNASPNTSDIGAGDIEVRAGTKIKAPQGFRRFYFRSVSATSPWQIEIVKIPNLQIINEKTMDDLEMAGSTETVAYSDSSPSSASDGNALSQNVKKAIVQIVTTSGPARLGVTVTCELWWYNSATGLWCHNPRDDFDSAGLTDADATHDVEVFEIPRGFTRVFVKRTNSATGWDARVSSIE